MTTTPQQRARRQQKVEELCAATMRALTGRADLHYRGRRLHSNCGALPMHAPHLRVDTSEDPFADCRAAADGMAMRLTHSDADLHRSLRPDEPVERLLFELLEQLRVESLVPADLPGVEENLVARVEHWSRGFHDAGLTEGQLGMLLYTVAQMCWSRLTARRVLEDTEDAIEGMRASLVGVLGGALAGIRRHRREQRAFAGYALEIARTVAGIVRAERGGADEKAGVPTDDEEADGAGRHFALLLDFDDGEGEAVATALSGDSKVFAEAEHAYRVFTARHDRELFAADQVRKALLVEYRERLDRRVAEQGVNLARVARMLGTVLAQPQRDGWRFGEEEGRIDGRRLAQLISSPAERRLFRRDQFRPTADCLVTFLIDCSGSMKTHAEPVATLVDILAKALEMVGARSEVLGFTTAAWNGGRAMGDWISAGRPRNPGRLNEVCHLVFKSAERNWRRARRELAALLKPDLYREGIDGEAVDWACERMLAHSVARRVLIVISDGCPADSATGLANDAFYLDNHLKSVLARREQQGVIEILGLGVGLDLSPFYRRCLATDMSQALDNALFAEIVGLVDGGRRR